VLSPLSDSGPTPSNIFCCDFDTQCLTNARSLSTYDPLRRSFQLAYLAEVSE
jgi:hypothetical protein